MNIALNDETKHKLSPEDAALVEKKLVAPLRLLGGENETAMLEVEIEEAPPEGRSSTPYRLAARLTKDGKVYYAEAVKPSPESAADRVRATLEAEIRHESGRSRSLFKRGASAIKDMIRFGS